MDTAAELPNGDDASPPPSPAQVSTPASHDQEGASECAAELPNGDDASPPPSPTANESATDDDQVQEPGDDANVDADTPDESHHTAEYRLETWYPVIKEHTFDTVILPFSKEEAQAITHGRDLVMQQKRLESFVGKQSVAANAPELTLSAEMAEAIENTTARLDEAIRSFGDKGAFIKLSSRSPKDAVLTGDKIKAYLREEVARMPVEEGADSTVEDIIAFDRAKCFALKVVSGEEAMDLLLGSHRVYTDITRWLLEKGDDIDMGLVVRGWEDIHPELEFRAFVSGRVLTGVTTYYPACFIPALNDVDNKAAILQAMKDKFAEVEADIPYDDYTIDFACMPQEGGGYKVWIIELNNPPPIAGTALFDWESEEDRRILAEGPFEFRTHDQVPADAFDIAVPPLITMYINALRSPGGLEEGGVFHDAGCDLCPKPTFIVGKLYKCTTCASFDLCERCYAEGSTPHADGHEFAVYESAEESRLACGSVSKGVSGKKPNVCVIS